MPCQQTLAKYRTRTSRKTCILVISSHVIVEHGVIVAMILDTYIYLSMSVAIGTRWRMWSHSDLTMAVMAASEWGV